LLLCGERSHFIIFCTLWQAEIVLSQALFLKFFYN